METNDHILAIEDLIGRKKNLENEAHRIIKHDKQPSMYEELNLKIKGKKKHPSRDNSPKANLSMQNSKLNSCNTQLKKNHKRSIICTDKNSFFKAESDETPMKNLKASKIEKDMTKYAIHKMLTNIQENSKNEIRSKNNTIIQNSSEFLFENKKRQNAKDPTKIKRRRKSPQQLYDDLNRQSWKIKIRKYKNPKLVPEALKLPQDDIDTLQHTETQTPVSMKYGNEKMQIINSKFDFYQLFVNSKLKRWAFNAWLSKWSRLEIKKMRIELRKAIDKTKDDIEEKQWLNLDDNSRIKIDQNLENHSEKDTEVNTDLYNRNFLKENIFIDESGNSNKENVEQIVDYYLGGE